MKDNLKVKDLTGLRFGHWTVNHRAPKDPAKKGRDIYWNCTCDCGTTKNVLGKYLRNGKSQSCGCVKKNKEYIGKRYGSLVVKEIIYGYNGNSRATYKCDCDCGETVFLTGDIYKRKSCGKCRYQHARIDHTGEKYGKLTVVEMLYNYKNNQTYCKCKCDCGNSDYITRMDALITGNTQSCGCAHSPNLTGKIFTYLTVLREAEKDEITTLNKYKLNQRFWLCKCVCGNYKLATTHDLMTGHVKSCGCLFNQSTSSHEIFISELLKGECISFLTQVTFDGLRGINDYPLWFDFYLDELNLVIEYDGKQHFEPVEYFGGVESYKIQIANDQVKNQFCHDNKINLLRLPYNLSDNEISLKIKTTIESIQESRNDHSGISNCTAYAGSYYCS